MLITGGGIANFTNVAATFKGIITALREFQPKLKEHNVSIYVRRAGPNYQEGLRKMREYGSTLGIPLHVFGPETHMTAICGMALGKRPIPQTSNADFATANFLLPGGQQQQESKNKNLGLDGTSGENSGRTHSHAILFRFHLEWTQQKHLYHLLSGIAPAWKYWLIVFLFYYKCTYLWFPFQWIS